MGVADPAMAEPDAIPPPTPPPSLLVLGALHVSADAVEGGEEGARFFPPGYSAPEQKPKQKPKKKKKVHSTLNLEQVFSDLAIVPAERYYLQHLLSIVGAN